MHIPTIGAALLVMSAVTAAAQPAAFTEHEVTFKNGDVTLAGTLTLPAGEGPHPAVILVSGSGAQNRDSELFGFRPFRVLAHAFAADGIAVLRYDDRGVGGSTGRIAQSTTADFAADALAGLDLLGGRADIRKDKRGIVGHSEGALAAGIAASRSRDVAFIVLMAGSTRPGADILLQQSRDMAKSMGASPEDAANIEVEHRKLTAAIRGGADEAAIREQMGLLARAQISALPPAQRAMVGDIDVAVAAAVKQQAAGMSSPWMRYFIDFDPAAILATVTCPVLAIFGEKDIQVPPASNREPLERALARNPAVTVKVYPGANHLFQPATTGLPTEYATLPKAFVEPLVADVSAWIRAHSR